MSMSPHLIAVTITAIVVSFIFCSRLCKTRNKSSGDKRLLNISVPSQVPPTILELQFIDNDAGGKCNPNMSAHACTAPRPQPVGHSSGRERHPGILGLPRGSHITSEPQILGDRDALSRRVAQDSKIQGILTTSAINHSPSGTRNDDNNSMPNPTEMQFIAPEPSIDHGGEDVQSREAAQGVDTDFSIPKDASSMVTELHSVDRGDRVMQRRDAPSTSFFQGSSNIEITGSSFYEVHGNTTIIRFGDGQCTEIQKDLICDYIANLTELPDIKDNLKEHVLTQSIRSLPRTKAVFDDYQNKKRTRPCFKGTREALLREMADWAITPGESGMYVLSGLAGAGKSTIAYTIASRTTHINLLGASFFFSRDEACRKNAENFFNTIAYQLCVYNETFAKGIGDALLTERGSAATTKDPQEQLQALIVEPLRSIVQSHPQPILIVVDALDECDEEDGISVLNALRQLIQDLPSFKVILTTRPQPYLNHFFRTQGVLRIFHLQDIENKIVDGDIRIYLQHCLSLVEVQRRYPQRQWRASDEEIDSLVHAAGRLFIIASTAVRYIFDKFASDPAGQMQKLLSAFAQAYTPFKDLDHFYAIILRNVVPATCDDHDIVDRYRSVVGAIIFVQQPLPIPALADLTNINMDGVRAVLDNLQSVILLDDDDVPRIYHQSFPDYLTRCEDHRLRIDPRICHVQIATRCFEIMNKHLKRNILGLGDLARFMSNEDGLNEDGIKEAQMQEKIPPQFRYTCVYWANHLEVANIEDKALMNGLEKFVNAYILYWFEALSLIGKLDSAHHAIRIVLKLLSTSSDLHQLLSDALRFISKFYEIMKRSALHTYYSALPFTPSDSLIFRRYIQEAVHNLCRIEGGPKKWDTLVASMSHEEQVDFVKFSLASIPSLFASCSEENVNHGTQGKLKIWDATTGALISTVPGRKFAVANDFSTVASSEDKTITFYNASGSARDAMISTLSKIENLALSSEHSRVAAALSDGTVWLWDSGNAGLIDSFDGFESEAEDQRYQLEFSPTGTRLAYSSPNSIQLRDGISGGFIADLRCGSSHRFEFSDDGSRLASVSRHDTDDILMLWNSESGGQIDAVTVLGEPFTISADGSLLATADDGDVNTNASVTLWKEKGGFLEQTTVLKLCSPQSMAFLPDNILIIATCFGVELYNIQTQCSIHTFPFCGRLAALAFSPDRARLAIGDYGGNVNLWDIQDIKGIDASSPPSEAAVTALALSRDCSRLACGFRDGTVQLWETSPQIGPLTRSKTETNFTPFFHQYRHTESVLALGFHPDDELFASASSDGTIKVWDGRNGTLRRSLKAPVRCLKTVALSNSMLVATWHFWYVSDEGNRLVCGVNLWRLDTPKRLDHTLQFEIFNERVSSVSIAENSTLIAIFHSGFSGCDGHITLVGVENSIMIQIARFDVPYMVHTMTFLRDNSKLVVQSNDGDFLSFNLFNKHIIEEPTLQYLIQQQLPNSLLWHDGVPIWHCQDKRSKQHYFAALFPQHKSPVPILWVPSETPVTAWTQGSSLIALGCGDGRVIFLRLPTSLVS